MNSINNPEPLSNLMSILGLKKVKHLPRGITKRLKRYEIDKLRKEIKNQLIYNHKILNKYKISEKKVTDHDYRTGYNTKTYSIYLYNGKYYSD